MFSRRFSPLHGTPVMTAMPLVMREARGSLVLRLAFVGPAVFLLAVGGVDLMAINRAQARLQTIAAGAAAAGVEGVAAPADLPAARSRAAAFVAAQMGEWAGAPTYEARYEIVDRGGEPTLHVVLNGHRPSFMANMLPPGGWHFVGDASAAPA
jgi:hypothetical protein